MRWMKAALTGIIWVLSAMQAASQPVQATAVTVPSSQAEETVALQAYYKQDYLNALPHFRAAAAAGNSEAMGYLGFMYKWGYGVEKDLNQSETWYQRASQNGSSNRPVDGQNCVSDCVDESLALQAYNKQDYFTALYYFEAAAARGNKIAMGYLGYMYKWGYGVAKDPDKSEAWYQRAGGNAANQAAAGSAAETASTQNDDNASRIEELRSDKDEQESEAEGWEQKAEELRDTSNCSGLSAATCRSMAEFGVSEARDKARKARRAAERDQQQIDELEGVENFV